MIIKRIKIENFRNIEKADITFCDKVTVLLGENAQGKTNAIEAIYLFSRGKSFRSSDEKDLLKEGADGFSLFLEYCDSEGKKSLEYAVFGKEKRRKKNGYNIDKIYEMIGNFKAVLFSPDDLSLIKGGPDERRGFINIAISKISDSYIKNYARYKRILENRNYLLKNYQKGLQNYQFVV